MNRDLLAARWWNAFCSTWNSSQCRQQLADLGLVGFQVRGDTTRLVFLYWDEFGSVLEVTPLSVGEVPMLSASVKSWSTFLDCPNRLLDMIVDGQIEITGHGAKLLPYIQAFCHVAEVANLAESNHPTEE